MEIKSHDLNDFMQSVTTEMSCEYNRIRKRATEDPGTAGDQGEENWAELFRNWLPPIYEVVTKGRILSSQGIASPQIDILILHPIYPKQLLTKKLYLAGGVAAAFECKVTLKAAHICSATKNAVEIRKYLPKRIGTPYKELHSSIIYGLLSHSHSWKGKTSTPVKRINNYLEKADSENVKHPREMLDLVCVADLATWSSTKRNPGFTSHVCNAIESQGQTTGFTPIGSLVSYLLYKLAQEEPMVRRLADYLFSTSLPGLGEGKARLWPNDIYSEEVRDRVASGSLSNEIWNEWSRSFW
ncbi:hypothetical protein H6F90_06860 [Trichocoleus sp. FACHB-591]|uniref:DUF6602 domain-containing protein n=1 Tax=Trichocoleus sp. FACHB-591 TaxID=2692872 RepID=UPI0016822F3D|nr:DUF6602 domain-containing protein [Trichocoleus sp. FACHB-591]MBD2094873.1 hypothetical protein [Trichocoleus sp. FACHB-591]